MHLTIHKGRHRPCWGFLTSRMWVNKRSLTRKAWFHPSCIYLLPQADQEDVNKLFGLGHAPFWKVLLIFLFRPLLPMLFNEHHKNSARFGWNCNPVEKTINLFAYTYVKGVRSFEKICEIDITTDYALTIEVLTSIYRFRVQEIGVISAPKELIVPRGKSSRWSYYLGLYFGGNRTAPHTMKVLIE